MPVQDLKFKPNQAVLKVVGYGENKEIVLVHHAVLRTAGVEDRNEVRAEKGTVNEEKLACNVSRAHNAVYELARCNPWNFFFTGTLDPSKYDRTDLEKFHKDLTQWLRNIGKKYGVKIPFLLVPELHKDRKSWHIHGFLNLPPAVVEAELHQFKLGDKMGEYLSKKVRLGAVIYNWVAYQKKFGFNDLEPIKNPVAVCKYIQKYITKDLAGSVSDLGAHMYYHSRGLAVAEIVKKGTMPASMMPFWDFQNDYVSKSSFPYSVDLVSALSDKILDLEYSSTHSRGKSSLIPPAPKKNPLSGFEDLTLIPDPDCPF